ncbi:hypothetical protein AWH63_10860 [Marinobacter sp. C18]|uniref:DUF5983 family protein n=1 Tax=Marinobacter sp. C18 TaxID=1772288 RepID=UPI0009490FC2|nr:hypothetical protein [Marinobacter sp. C18]OLF82031.1 hypothetical protein AWH63_10860 [Marinobacter sp. C18]
MSIHAQPDPAKAETYRAVAMTTAHLRLSDNESLECAAKNPQNNLVMGRETGFLIKLPAGDDKVEKVADLSDEAQRILKWASEAGFRAVEFDNVADMIDGFPTFNW